MLFAAIKMATNVLGTCVCVCIRKTRASKRARRQARGMGTKTAKHSHTHTVIALTPDLRYLRSGILMAMAPIDDAFQCNEKEGKKNRPKPFAICVLLDCQMCVDGVWRWRWQSMRLTDIKRKKKTEIVHRIADDVSISKHCANI